MMETKKTSFALMIEHFDPVSWTWSGGCGDYGRASAAP
jgi:hypothetical protein